MSAAEQLSPHGTEQEDNHLSHFFVPGDNKESLRPLMIGEEVTIFESEDAYERTVVSVKAGVSGLKCGPDIASVRVLHQGPYRELPSGLKVRQPQETTSHRWTPAVFESERGPFTATDLLPGGLELKGNRLIGGNVTIEWRGGGGEEIEPPTY